MNSKNSFEHWLTIKLNLLKQIPDRDPEKTLSGRIAFLNESVRLSRNVSPFEKQRHKNYKQNNTHNFWTIRKEHKPMFSTLTSFILAITLILGGGGVTVAAAQSSIPGDFLYDMKLLSENTLLAITNNPENQLELALDLTDRRSDELSEILTSGNVPESDTLLRYQDQIDRAIVLAFNLPPEDVIQAFQKIKDRLQIQEMILSQAQLSGVEEANMLQLQTRQMIQERLRILENGQYNMLQIQNQLNLSETTVNPDQQNENTNSGGNVESTEGMGENNPWMTEVPGHNAEYGPGDNGGSETSGTPSPEAGYGPGPGGDSTIIPPADHQNGYYYPTENGASGGFGNRGN